MKPYNITYKTTGCIKCSTLVSILGTNTIWNTTQFWNLYFYIFSNLLPNYCYPQNILNKIYSKWVRHIHFAPPLLIQKSICENQYVHRVTLRSHIFRSAWLLFHVFFNYKSKRSSAIWHQMTACSFPVIVKIIQTD